MSARTHGPSLLKSTVAHPCMKPGSLVNHSMTSKMKMTSTDTSANFILPRLLYSSLITRYASLSLWVFPPQPNDCFRLKRKEEGSAPVLAGVGVNAGIQLFLT